MLEDLLNFIETRWYEQRQQVAKKVPGSPTSTVSDYYTMEVKRKISLRFVAEITTFVREDDHEEIDYLKKSLITQIEEMIIKARF